MQNACKVHFGLNESAAPSVEGNLLPVPWHFGQDPSLFTVGARRFVSGDGLLGSAPPEEHFPRHGQFPTVYSGLRDAANHFPQSPLFPGWGWEEDGQHLARGVSSQETGEHPTPRLIAHAFPYGNTPWERSPVTGRIPG